ncbi:MAG: hypothetical protein KAV82_07810 [Phycisphaerae bacterium]|nr:hypothetical protein [Phycisphaerae bacterium]
MPSIRPLSIITLGGLVLLSGCSLTGSWSTIEVKPEYARFPIASVTFTDEGTYCVTHGEGVRADTSSGTYEWAGSQLRLKPQGQPPQTYSGTLRLGGTLALTLETGNGVITAVLEKQKDKQTEAPQK